MAENKWMLLPGTYYHYKDLCRVGFIKHLYMHAKKEKAKKLRNRIVFQCAQKASSNWSPLPSKQRWPFLTLPLVTRLLPFLGGFSPFYAPFPYVYFPNELTRKSERTRK